MEVYVVDEVDLHYDPAKDRWILFFATYREDGTCEFHELEAIKVEFAGWIEGSATRYLYRPHETLYGCFSIKPYGTGDRRGIRKVVIKYSPFTGIAYIAVGTSGRLASIFRRWGVPWEGKG